MGEGVSCKNSEKQDLCRHICWSRWIVTGFTRRNRTAIPATVIIINEQKWDFLFLITFWWKFPLHPSPVMLLDCWIQRLEHYGCSLGVCTGLLALSAPCDPTGFLSDYWTIPSTVTDDLRRKIKTPLVVNSRVSTFNTVFTDLIPPLHATRPLKLLLSVARSRGSRGLMVTSRVRQSWHPSL